MLYRSLLIIFIGLSFIANNTAQSQLAIGDWEVHLPFKVGKHLTYSEEKVYYATDFALMSIDKQTFEKNYITKVDGLHDVKIISLAYDPNSDILLLAYENSKMDVVTPDGIFLVNDIFDKSILGDKTIYDIYISDESIAYLSTGFGIVQFDLDTRLFGFYTETPFRVNTFVEFDETWYAGTDDGLYVFEKSSSANPSNFAAWTLLGEEVGLEMLYSVADLYISETAQLHLATTSAVYAYDLADAKFTILANTEAIGDPTYLFDYNQKLHVGIASPQNFVGLYAIENSQLTQVEENCVELSSAAYQDQYGTLWTADDYDWIRLLQNGECKYIFPDGPTSSKMSELLFVDDTLYVASGGVSDNYSYLFDRSGIYTYADRKWTNFNEKNTAIMADSNMLSQYTIAKNPVNDHLMIGTYWNGLLDLNLKTKAGIVHNKYTGSTLTGVVGDEARTRIGGLAYDKDDNLWISNFGSSKPLSVLTHEGVWHSFNVGVKNTLTDIVIDDLGYKWIAVGGTQGGVTVFDDGGTLADPTDDRYYFINEANSELDNSIIYSIVKDNDGDIWVGSDLGPVIFQCGSNVFEGECEGTTRKVLQDSILAVLLKTESIRTIAVDGANRKWFGTTNGVFVQSADGNTQINHYTIENSPLLDNTIIDIAFDGDNGIAYIATNSGLNALKTEATAAKYSHAAQVYAYPNPVRPDYAGPIAIKGLSENANVKITDINGLLISELTATGGQAIWDGLDYNGEKASTGIYLVFSSSTDTFRDPDTYVTKIMLVK